MSFKNLIGSSCVEAGLKIKRDQACSILKTGNLQSEPGLYTRMVKNQKQKSIQHYLNNAAEKTT